MSHLQAIFLGIVQGLTEFLPISSSGHLVIFEHLLKISSENVLFEVSVHFGTLFSVIAVYYKDLLSMIRSFFKSIFRKAAKGDPYLHLIILIVIGTIPAVIGGFIFEDIIVSIFHETELVGVALVMTGVVISITGISKIKKNGLNVLKALIIGVAQMIAILPGVSRSGFTISAGLFLGLPREESARFSFLLAIPAIAGAVVLHIGDLLNSGPQNVQTEILLIGFFVSSIIGYISIRSLLRIIQSGKFIWFAPYCIMVGLATLVFMG